MPSNFIRKILVLIMCVLVTTQIRAEELEMNTGSQAPEFSLHDQNNMQRNLADYRGQWVVLYFYPKDDTPGCTVEACQFRDDYFEIKKLGAVILGVSMDDAKSHAEFSKKHGLPFPLLADIDGVVAKNYGALWGIWPVRFAKRHTFVIDPEGKIAKIYRDVDPKKHSAELIAVLKELTASQK